MIENIVNANGLIFAFFIVGVIMYLSYLFSKKVLNNMIPGAAIAIIIALILAFMGEDRGISNLPYMGGMAILGGSMLRDFSVVATAMGVDISKIKQAGDKMGPSKLKKAEDLGVDIISEQDFNKLLMFKP